MKDQKFIFPALLSILACVFSFSVSAQVQTPFYNVSMTSYSNGYYEYLPQGYNTSSNNFPLIIFCHGSGEVGNGSPSQLPLVLKNGTPKQISQGIFPNYFITNGDTFRCIVLSPQFISNPPPQEISNIIDYAISHYRVDINRIYLTGLSNGGGDVWNYAGDNPGYANRVAAIVPVCGFSWPDPVRAQIIAAANLAVWATHNNGDPVVPVSYTIDYTNNIDNAPVPPSPLAKRSIFNSNSHDAWSHTYDFTFREDGYNVYEWMFRFQRSFTPLPVNGLTFNAVKKNSTEVQLTWSTASETNNKGFELQRSIDGIHYTAISFIASSSINGSGSVYSYTDALPQPGKNYYRLKQIDLDAHFTYSVVRFADMSKISGNLSIYPNPVAATLNINSTHLFRNAMLHIYNMIGQQVTQTVINGNGTISVETTTLTPGSYKGSITEGTAHWLFSFIKK